LAQQASSDKVPVDLTFIVPYTFSRMTTLKIFVPIAVTTLLLLASTSLASSPKVYGDAVVAEVTSIYDGDTFKVNLQGYPPITGERIGIRINGIDTPEMKDNRPKIKALARKAKQYTVERSREGKQIILRNMQRGKYFRIVADVYVDGSNLGQELISAGLAKPYDGGKKPKW
jgi:endonuclease YncB( thermonuclease family)